MTPNLTPGLINAKINNIQTLILEWGEAAAPFLSIEPLMRYIGEVHQPVRNKAENLLKKDPTKQNKRYIHYWDCNPKYLVGAIELEFGAILSQKELDELRKYCDIRDKFLHGNFISLMEVMGKPPYGRIQVGLKKKKLEPGEIYESILGMKSNEVFHDLRQYSNALGDALFKILRSLPG
jgi:hypothetical protein